VEPKSGQEIRGFRIEQEIDRGGMGVVFRARQVRLNRPVAIKMLAPHLTRERGFISRFEREAQTLARLAHEGIVRVIDYFEEDDVYFLAMELVHGRTLRSWLEEAEAARTPPDLDAALSVVRQIADALAFAHAQGVIHRDLKPENVMIEETGRVKLMDFGLAQMLGETRLTEAGFRVGTVQYMSPEQYRGEPLDPRSDLFSLGVIFFEMLFLRRPFPPSELLDLPNRATPAVPWPAAAPDSRTEKLKGVVRRLLGARPSDRYAGAGDFLEALESALPETPALPAQKRMARLAAELKRLKSLDTPNRESPRPQALRKATPAEPPGAATPEIPPAPAPTAKPRRRALAVGLSIAGLLTVGSMVVMRQFLDFSPSPPKAIPTPTPTPMPSPPSTARPTLTPMPAPRDPAQAERLFREAMFQASRGDIDGARGTFEEALRSDPANLEVAIQYALFLWKSCGDRRAALERLRFVEKQRPDYPNLQQTLEAVGRTSDTASPPGAR